MSQTWDDTLRASGYRVTPQRQLVLEAVTRLEHATPEEIFADVRQTARGVNVSTVYRTLELLEQIGLVTHTHLGHGAPRYHLAAEAKHVHLVCRECEQVTQVDPAAVRPPGHRAGRGARFRDRRRAPDRVRPLRRLPRPGGRRGTWLADRPRDPGPAPHSLARMTSPLLAEPGAVPADGPDAGVAAHYGDPYAEQRALAGAAGPGRPLAPRRDHGSPGRTGCPGCTA